MRPWLNARDHGDVVDAAVAECESFNEALAERQGSPWTRYFEVTEVTELQ